ncbi:type II secretion system protein GspN [Geomesophilobacter sediminis]|uniref:Type II secretion system protein GspN n=1 Tax=Geomesophilobacter sediminis TaxID=2798584 RepID=A0A8J7S6X2_9BACT|nr:type II secretion system protein GspN [Geomesophilobacter sediminis]MBJ6726637.1 type II secretion system protein GspN [Geomesophilobacter sediminis]
MKGRALYLVCGIPAGVVLFVLLTVWFIPNDAIMGLMQRGAENAGYTLAFTGFGKRPPLAVKADAMELTSAKGPLLKLTQVKAGLEILPLFTGKVRLGYQGRIGAGEVRGDVDLGKGKGWGIEGSKIRLEDIPFFTSVAGAQAKGELKLQGRVADKKGAPAGELQLQVSGAELAGVKIGEMPLPDAKYRDVRGALGIDGGVAHLKSFTLDGDGIYVRLKGDVPLAQPAGNSVLNLTLEMMPRPEFLERQKFIFLVLLKYQTSPGAYTIPIRGTLAHPAL